jgi:hypothetical protein
MRPSPFSVRRSRLPIAGLTVTRSRQSITITLTALEALSILTVTVVLTRLLFL